ncbi:hypothetical protein LAY57_12590 [Argonema antarcticum A004/B2]|nr:hypothetical protein [Argonema antarcticum A004/B2]
MFKRLLQAAIITFSIQMLASISSPTTLQTSSTYRLRSNPTPAPIAILLHRLFQSQKTSLK